MASQAQLTVIRHRESAPQAAGSVNGKTLSRFGYQLSVNGYSGSNEKA